MIKLVWLIASLAGAPLGVYVFPGHITMEECTPKVNATAFTADEHTLAEYISTQVGHDISVTPTCLTDAEVADMLSKLKVQEDHSGVNERDVNVVPSKF